MLSPTNNPFDSPKFHPFSTDLHDVDSIKQTAEEQFSFSSLFQSLQTFEFPFPPGREPAMLDSLEHINQRDKIMAKLANFYLLHLFFMT
jgi:hypothetical protein